MHYRKNSRSPSIQNNPSSQSHQPHISIPGMGSEEKQRLGSPPVASTKSTRLWLIPPVVLLLYLLSIVFHPSSSQLSQGSFKRDSLSRNYLSTEGNRTLHDLPNPFEFCPTGGSGDAFSAKYGPTNLARTRVHSGSGVRVQRVLRRAMTGLPVTISVLGGSISACHAAGDDPISHTCWPAKFFEWWNSVFPHPASELTNGAMRKTDSGYYAFCHSHHIPDRTDLIILDFDTSDSNDPDYRNHFELLVRSLLIRPDHPAVIILGHFSPQYQEQHGFIGPELTHASVAQFYDVPHISMKPLLYSSYVSSPDSIKALYVDPILSNSAGHTLLADTIAAYLETQICQTWSLATSPDIALNIDPAAGGGVLGGVGIRKGDPAGNAGSGAGGGLGGGGTPHKEPNYAAVGYVLDSAPPPFLSTTHPHNLHAFREVEPFCVSANDLINPLPPSLFYDSGWRVFHPEGTHQTDGHKGAENAHYWYSTLPTSKLRVPVKLGAGDVGIYYMKEPRSTGQTSEIHCWVDDNYPGAVPIQNGADTDIPRPALKIIDRAVAKGSHNVECVLQGDEGTAVPPFKILGIFAT